MTPEDWQREDVLAVCEGCKRFGRSRFAMDQVARDGN